MCIAHAGKGRVSSASLDEVYIAEFKKIPRLLHYSCACFGF